MSQEPTPYILGTSDAELERLGYQHQVWGNEAHRLWESAGFGLGQELLDLGCGPGYATLDLAHLVGAGGTVHALDASSKYLSVLKERAGAGRLRRISTHVGDVHALPFADGVLDGVFARWVLCFVQDPKQAVAEVHRTLRPGGAVAIMDYFNYLAVGIFPPRNSFARLFQGFHSSVVQSGGSYDIGNVLPQMLKNAGFRVERLIPICRVARPNSREWNWLKLFTESYVPKLVEEGMIGLEEQEQLKRDWNEVSEDPNAFFFTPPMLGIVARKGDAS